MEEVAEGASEGTSEGSSLDGRQRGQRGRSVVVFVVLQQVLGRSRGTSGRLFFFFFSVLGLVRGPVEGQRFVGSGAVGSLAFLVLQGQQLVVLFLGAGMHGQGAAQTRSR